MSKPSRMCRSLRWSKRLHDRQSPCKQIGRQVSFSVQFQHSKVHGKYGTFIELKSQEYPRGAASDRIHIWIDFPHSIEGQYTRETCALLDALNDYAESLAQSPFLCESERFVWTFRCGSSAERCLRSKRFLIPSPTKEHPIVINESGESGDGHAAVLVHASSYSERTKAVCVLVAWSTSIIAVDAMGTASVRYFVEGFPTTSSSHTRISKILWPSLAIEMKHQILCKNNGSVRLKAIEVAVNYSAVVDSSPATKTCAHSVAMEPCELWDLRMYRNLWPRNQRVRNSRCPIFKRSLMAVKTKLRQIVRSNFSDDSDIDESNSCETVVDTSCVRRL